VKVYFLTEGVSSRNPYVLNEFPSYSFITLYHGKTNTCASKNVYEQSHKV